MILFFRFLVLLFCFLSFSQELVTELPLLVKKDSISFYSFSKKGVSVFSFNDKGKLTEDYKGYDKPIPRSLESLELKGVDAVSNGDIVYFIYPGGGILYRFKNNVIERVDESFAHRNQLSGKFFMYNKTLYLLGGYGYWESNSYLTKFNFQSGSWDLVSVSGQTPKKGINQGSYLQKDNVLYVFNFYETSATSSIYNSNMYELNLDDFRWSKKGVINSIFDNEIEKAYSYIKLSFSESLIVTFPKSFEFQLITPNKNLVEIYKTEQLNQFTENSIIVGDNLIYNTLNAENSGFSMVVKTLSELLSSPSKKELLYNDVVVFNIYLIVAGSILLILLLTVFVYFKTSHKAFYLSSDSIYTEEKSIPITKNETYFLKLLTNSRSDLVENTLILNHFKNDSISLDASIKRKNNMISSLNKKFFGRFDIILITKGSDPKDSRQVYYTLSPSIKLISKKT